MIESFRYIGHAFVVPAEGDAIDLDSGSDFQQGMRDLIANGAGPGVIRERASAVLEGLLTDPNLLARTPSYGQLRTELRALKDPNASDLTDLVQTIVNQTPDALVQSSEFAVEKGVLNDAPIAIKMTTGFDRADAVGMTTMRPTMAFLENFVEGISPLTAAEIRKRLDRPSQVPPEFILGKSLPTEPVPPSTPLDPERVRLETLVASALHVGNSMSWAALYGVTGPTAGCRAGPRSMCIDTRAGRRLVSPPRPASIASGLRFATDGHDPLRLARLRPSAACLLGMTIAILGVLAGLSSLHHLAMTYL